MEITMAKVLEELDVDKLVKLAMDLVNISSPTGEEEQVADFVLDWFKSHGFKTVRQEVEDRRPNAIGIIKGSGTGKSLMFNAHMDTSFSGTEADYLALGDIADSCKPNAYIKDSRICGLGINNDKGPLAACMAAALAIKDSGVELNGDMVIAGVVGEIGRAPVGRHSGKETRGKGVGTRFLLTHGIVTDYAIVAEPSSFTLTWTLPGAVFLRLTTTGRPAYTPFTRRDDKGWSSENAVIKMTRVLELLEHWGAEYEQKYQYAFSGGLIIPKLNVGAIEGGMPFKPNYSPAICHAYVDIRIPPGMKPLEVKRMVERYLQTNCLEVEVDMYLSQQGYEGRGVEPVLEVVRQAHNRVFGNQPEQISTAHTSMWNDVNIYHELGIPAVKYGPPTISYGKKREESLSIDDLAQASKVYALSALQICNS